MGGQDNGLTLEGLAKRLEALERENERIRFENAELRDEVNVLRGSRTHREEQAENSGSDGSRHKEALSRFEGKVSRRSLLSKAGVATAGLVVAGALTQRDIREAKAAQVIGDSNEPNRGGVEGTTTATFGYGVLGTGGIYGVRGKSSFGGDASGVQGVNTFSGFGVVGISQSGTGVQGLSQTNGPGVEGVSSTGSKAGVLGKNTFGEGVRGEGSTEAFVAGVRGLGKIGVWGSTGVGGHASVYGQHTGSFGYGVVGDGTGTGSSGAGVLGRNNKSSGVRGEGVNGVHGKATSGYGGLFEGGKAQLRLVPKGTAGKPTSGAHTKGEIYMDSAGTLFVCTASGTPGTWRKVTTTAA